MAAPGMDYRKAVEEARSAYEAWKPRASNADEALYFLLGECLRIVQHASTDLHGFRAALKGDLTKAGIKTIASTKLENSVVKLVFRDDDRRRASKYGRVLRVARNRKRSPEELVDWLRKATLEGVKEEQADRTAAKEQQLEKGRAMLASGNLGGFKTTLPYRSGFLLLIAEMDKPDRMIVRAAVEDETERLVEQAILRYVKEAAKGQTELLIRPNKQRYTRAEWEEVARQNKIEVTE
jgi:hypothetical protein